MASQVTENREATLVKVFKPRRVVIDAPAPTQKKTAPKRRPAKKKARRK